MAITTRSGKGSQLTWAEMDANLTELDTRTAINWQNLNGEMVTDGISNAPPMRLYNSTLYMRAFSPDTEQEVSCIFHTSKDYIAGTDTWPHGHIVTPTASSGTVRWKITMSFANEGAVFSAPYTFYVDQSIVAADQDKHLLIEPPTAMSIPTLSTDSIILFRVARDATHINDTYPDEIYLTQIDLYYQSQGFGESVR
jgi:hypothetical protein